MPFSEDSLSQLRSSLQVQTKTKGFLDFPVELRIKVYRNCYILEYDVNCWIKDVENVYSEMAKPCASSQLLRTCRTCYREGIDILYSENKFALWNAGGAHNFLAMIDTVSLKRIKHLCYPNLEAYSYISWLQKLKTICLTARVWTQVKEEWMLNGLIWKGEFPNREAIIFSYFHPGSSKILQAEDFHGSKTEALIESFSGVEIRVIVDAYTSYRHRKLESNSHRLYYNLVRNFNAPFGWKFIFVKRQKWDETRVGWDCDSYDIHTDSRK